METLCGDMGMKFFAGTVLFFCALLLAGQEPVLRIADTLGDTLFRAAAIQMALAGKNITCTQEQMTEEKALAALQKGDVDLVLIHRSRVPEKWQSRCRDYGVEAAMIGMNAQNSRHKFSSRELAEAFSGWKRSWLTLNGSDFQIHLMRQPDTAPAVRIFQRKIMGKRRFAPAFIRENPLELLRLAEVNEHALVLTCRPDMELAIGLRAAEVDGVYPSLENVKNGRYPLSDRRTVIFREKKVPAGERLLEFILSPAMEKTVAEHGLIRP